MKAQLTFSQLVEEIESGNIKKGDYEEIPRVAPNGPRLFLVTFK